MNNRPTNLLLLILVIMGAYWFWKQPATRDDATKLQNAMEEVGDKAVDAAAKATNELERAAEKTKEKAEELKEEFNDARERERLEND